MSNTEPPSKNKPTATGSERRQHERVTLRGIAHLLLPNHEPIEVRIFDIGIGGVGIIAAANPPANLTCTVRVAIPQKPHGSTTIEVPAKVVHSILSGSDNGFKIGLQFTDLSASAKSAIMQFVLARSSPGFSL